VWPVPASMDNYNLKGDFRGGGQSCQFKIRGNQPTGQISYYSWKSECNLNFHKNVAGVMPKKVCGLVWCGVILQCGVAWCGVVWCGEEWPGVVWNGVVGCGVEWCGTMLQSRVAWYSMVW
jgi:hypothetical protein